MRRRLASRLVASTSRAAAFAAVTAGLVLGAVSARAADHSAAAKAQALPGLVVLTAEAGPPTNDRAAAASPSRRQRELEDLRRQDLARDLEARGVPVRWQEHPLAELVDWRDRIDAARALAADFGAKVDWRAESAAALMDMRLRAAKAAELRATFGLVLDWRRYGWPQLERIRSSLAAATSDPSTGDAAVRTMATGDAHYRDALVPFDAHRKVRRPARISRDRDAIIEPLFASTAPARAAARLAALHPDGILEPNFSRPSPRPSERGADALAEPRL